MVKVEFKTNSDGHPRLYLNKFPFKKLGNRGEKVYWVCARKNCKSRAHTIKDKLVLYTGKHSRRVHNFNKQHNNNNDDQKTRQYDEESNQSDDDDDEPLIKLLPTGTCDKQVKRRLSEVPPHSSVALNSDSTQYSHTESGNQKDKNQITSSLPKHNNTSSNLDVPTYNELGYRKLQKIKNIKSKSNMTFYKETESNSDRTFKSSVSKNHLKDSNNSYYTTDSTESVSQGAPLYAPNLVSVGNTMHQSMDYPSPLVPLHQMVPLLYQVIHTLLTRPDSTCIDRGDDAAEFPGTSAGGGGGGMGLEDTTSPPEHFLNDSMAPTPQHPIPPPASNRPESYKLCHNNHLSLVLEALAADESFMDVTLTAQGKSLKAHKSVLSAVSPYFRGVLKDNPCQHPIIIMPRDVKYDELNNIISYIYRGEMTVATEDLPSLLKTAEILQVTGLSPSESMPGVGGLNDTMSSAMQSPVPRTPQHKGHQANKHTSASSIQSLDSTSNSDIIVPADFMDVNLTCVKEEIANLEETTINNTDEDNTTTNTNTENNDDSIIEDDDDDGGDDPVENHRPPAKRRRTNPKSPDTNDTTTTNNTDADPKPNQCPYCETSPKDYNAIMDHMKEKHSNKKPFICSNCCRIYIKNDPYSEHVKACPKAST